MQLGKYKPPHAAEDRFAEFQAAVEQQRTAGFDAFGQAHNEGFADYLASSPPMQAFFSRFLEESVSISPTNVARRIPKSFQAVEMKKSKDEGGDFPAGYDRPEAWTPAFDRLAEDAESQFDHIINLVLPIASNVSERGKLLKATVLLHDLDQPVRIMDLGCSLNHNLKRLALYGEGGLTYLPTEVAERQRHNRLVPALGRTAAFNRLVQDGELRIGPSAGVDLYNADKDDIFAVWAKSNSFYMSELLDPVRTAQFDRLADARPPQLSFIGADVARTEQGQFGEDRYDVVYLSTMLYQLSAEEVQQALENAHQNVEPDGLIIVQDFAEFDENDTPHFYEQWEWAGHYTVWVKDMKNPEAGFQKYFTADGGRVRQITVEPAAASLAVAREVGLAPAPKRSIWLPRNWRTSS